LVQLRIAPQNPKTPLMMLRRIYLSGCNEIIII